MATLHSAPNVALQADYSNHKQNTLDGASEHELDPSWIPSWISLPKNGANVDYELSGRSREHSYQDFRSARHARHRLSAEKNRYYGYHGVNRGQLGAKHYQPNENVCSTLHGYSTPLAEADTSTMTKKTLCHEAQHYPRPPGRHRARHCDGERPQIRQRMLERKGRSKNMREDLEDADDYWFQNYVHGSNFMKEDRNEWWWTSKFGISAEDEILSDADDVMSYGGCSEGSQVADGSPLERSFGYGCKCKPGHEEGHEEKNAAPLSAVSTTDDVAEHDEGWQYVMSNGEERSRICSDDNPHASPCDSRSEFEIVTRHYAIDSDWTQI